jgi:hypothetical protein
MYLGLAMARVTIEESWWTDPRRELFAEKVGNRCRADGIVIRMWFLGKQHGLVPRKLFDAIPYAADLISVGLAEVSGDKVRVKGSKRG